MFHKCTIDQHIDLPPGHTRLAALVKGRSFGRRSAMDFARTAYASNNESGEVLSGWMVLLQPFRRRTVKYNVEHARQDGRTISILANRKGFSAQPSAERPLNMKSPERGAPTPTQDLTDSDMSAYYALWVVASII
jgi:hypothetical protein